jgi:S-adenosylmethionine-diacylgycerolhomoserine-N-methlytransferase
MTPFLTQLRADLPILQSLLFKPLRGTTHAERLENFYGPQAASYDNFRDRLLWGRKELFAEAAARIEPGSVVVDMGAGTGRNIEFLKQAGCAWSEIHLVDLSPSLLSVAKDRASKQGWQGAHYHLTDARTFELSAGRKADLVTFSYSLTMIPDWFSALEQAVRIVKPGGWIGVVDFFLPRKFPDADQPSTSALARTFWQHWFALDNVFLSPDHLPYLQSRLKEVVPVFGRQKIPYLPFLKPAHYRLLGQVR